MRPRDNEPPKFDSNAKGAFDSDFEPGKLLGGRYRVISTLGKGGMGTVYRVEQIFLGTELALKTINASSLTADNIRRFQAEAKAAFAVNHPNVISVHDFGLLDEDTPFMAMELVKGKTLSEILKQGILKIDDALPIFIQVCAGLSHAHQHGITHRDIKPSNIMVLDQVDRDTEGSVKILDFGIAKLAQHEQGEIQSLTRTGEVFGSPLYMSPEQCSGGVVDNRSDIYSLGCVFFEALTGTSPYVGENALTTMIMHQSSTIPSLREASLGENFPKDLEQLVQHMLAKEPSERYQTVKQILADLTAISKGESIQGKIHIEKANIAKPKSSTKITISKSLYVASFVLNAVICGLSAAAAMHYLVFPKMFKSEKPVDLQYEQDKTYLKPTNQITERISQEQCDFIAGFGVGNLDLSNFRGYTEAQSLVLEQEIVDDRQLKNLKDSLLLHLKLHDCKLDTIYGIKDFPYLQTLDLQGTQIDDRAAPFIASLKMLQTVNVVGTKFTGKGLTELSRSTSLREIIPAKMNYPDGFIDSLKKQMVQCKLGKHDKKDYLEKLSDKMKQQGVADFERLLKLTNVAREANPDLSVISENLQQMAEIRMGEHKYDEANSLATKALEQAKRIGDLPFTRKPLRLLALLSVAKPKPTQEDFSKYAKYMNESAKVAIDTQMHNSPELMQNLNASTVHAAGSTLYAYELNNIDVALKYIRRYPALQKDFYALFLEKAAWYAKLANQPSRGLYPARELVEWQATQFTKKSPQYGKALVLAGRLEPDASKKQSTLTEAIKTFDEIGCPNEENFKEHYCDACRELIDLFDHQKNNPAATEYSRKALTMADSLAPDVYDRRKLFATILIAHLQASGTDKKATDIAQKYNISVDSLNLAK